MRIVVAASFKLITRIFHMLQQILNMWVTLIYIFDG